MGTPLARVSSTPRPEDPLLGGARWGPRGVSTRGGTGEGPTHRMGHASHRVFQIPFPRNKIILIKT